MDIEVIAGFLKDAAVWLNDTIPYIGEYLAWPFEQLLALLLAR